MTAKNPNRVRLTRLYWKTTLPVLIVLTLLAATTVPACSAHADYSEPDELQTNAGNNESSSTNEDFYDPAVLQQEVEASEHRADTMEEPATEVPLKDLNNMSHNHIATDSMAMDERENMTDSMMEDDSESMPSEEYDEPISMEIIAATTASNKAATTMIPEYVRKGKSEKIDHPMVATKPKPEAEANVSYADYSDDDANDLQRNKDIKAVNDLMDTRLAKAEPVAMKYADDQTNNSDSQKPYGKPQAQLLPHKQRFQPFQPFQQPNMPEDEDLDSNEHERVDNFMPFRTTVAPADILPEGVGARGSFPDFKVPLSGLWTTSSEPTTAAATPLPLDVQTSPATSTSVETSTTTSRPPGKQGKQINITRRKLLPHEQLRNYIEDAYIRMPLAVIVDPSDAALDKTKALWHDALRTNLNIKIVLVALNASGTPSAFKFNNTRQFLAGLSSIKKQEGGNAFIGIVHASELVPYDSAVFISTATVPKHTELVQDAAITLLKKRIRLFVIWYGERSISENETQEAMGGILGEVAIRSGGEILHIVGSKYAQELEGESTLTLVADAFRGSQEIEIPVDTTLASLHVKIDAPMRTATLETPNGDINLRKLIKFKSRLYANEPADKRLDAYVPLIKLRKAAVYTLKLVPESEVDEYGVFVRGERKADLFLDDMIRRFDSYLLNGIAYSPTKHREHHLQSLTAALATARKDTHDNLRFEDEGEEIETNDQKQPKTEVETFSETEIKKTPVESIPAVLANATDVATLGNQRTATNALRSELTKIEMGIQSQILVAPGMTAQLLFEVTNTRTESVFHNIQVVDERRFLLRLVPQSLFLRPGEMATVAVTVRVPNGTPQGTIDRITFTCHGGETATLSLNLKVMTTLDSQDTTPPTVAWYWGNRCENIAYDSASCAERFWSIDITAQDWQTGVLRLQSTPSGLIYRNSYTVGSTEPLRATYIATCCEPKVALVAYDIAGNQRSYNIDVRDLVLTEAAIAAIVLGVLLLLLLIILLIAGIVWCCRRRKDSLDLPTYRSHSSRSME